MTHEAELTGQGTLADVEGYHQRRTTCPDCESEMYPIKLIDSTGQGGDRALGYAAGDAEQSRWLRVFPIEGKVGARMCPTCGRIVLHAEPA